MTHATGSASLGAVPTYDFEDAQGHVYGIDYPMSAAPAIGEVIQHEGQRLTRVPSIPSRPKVAINPNFVSETLPLHWPYAEKHDSIGRCVFTSRDSINKAVAKAKGTRDEVGYLR